MTARTIAESVADILQDIKTIFLVDEPWERRSLLQRVELACYALTGQALEPDLGPWDVSADGSTISSDNFDHDVLLRVSGDFYGEAPRIAYSKELASRLNRP